MAKKSTTKTAPTHLTPREASELIGRPQKWISVQIRSGRLPAELNEAQTRWLIPVKALEALDAK